MKLATTDRDRLRDLTAELDVVHLDRPDQVASLLPAMRALLEADNLLVLCPVQRATGWAVERFDSDNFPRDAGFERRFLRFFDTAPARFAWYDASRPEPDQRNRVIDALDIIPAGEYEASRIYTEVMRPTNVHRHRQPRALLCDGPSLLAWFGAFHARRFDARQNAVLDALIEPMCRRLRVERRLSGTPQASAVLEAAMERLGSPAFVVDARARVFEANSAGRALFDQKPDLRDELRGAISGEASPFELTAIADGGVPRAWLAIYRAGSRDERLAAALAAASARWRLTPRQRQVLELVLHGDPTTTIAARLHISERAVEQHLTALFERAGVAGRAPLIAAVLSSA